MRAFNDIGLLHDRPAFVGRWRQGVCSLRCLGAPPMAGISHRPVFAGEPVTILALNNIPAACQGRDWREVKPTYAGRRQHSLKTKPKALTSAVAKYVHEIKRDRLFDNRRKARRHTSPPYPPHRHHVTQRPRHLVGDETTLVPRRTQLQWCDRISGGLPLDMTQPL